MTGRLSTCARCSGTIERQSGSVAGWGHVTETPRNADGHRPEPDDSAISGPDDDDDADPECDCDDCEEQRALDEDADAYAERCEP
jgi:hypothetical protein